MSINISNSVRAGVSLELQDAPQAPVSAHFGNREVRLASASSPVRNTAALERVISDRIPMTTHSKLKLQQLISLDIKPLSQRTVNLQ